jgi:hypothetical protein
MSMKRARNPMHLEAQVADLIAAVAGVVALRSPAGKQSRQDQQLSVKLLGYVLPVTGRLFSSKEVPWLPVDRFKNIKKSRPAGRSDSRSLRAVKDERQRVRRPTLNLLGKIRIWTLSIRMGGSPVLSRPAIIPSLFHKLRENYHLGIPLQRLHSGWQRSVLLF